MKFNWQIKGHDAVLKSLESDVMSNKTAHAYLLAGPAGVGKFRVALDMALILQCDSEMCGQCNVCKEIEKGYHCDTLILRDDGEKVKIEQIRQVIEKVNMTGTGNYKILVMESIERMTPTAANAMLKTLEDPPANVLFLLTTSNLKDVLATIVSRVRLIQFSVLNDEDVEAVIRERFPLAEARDVEKARQFAGGRPGTAVRLMNDPKALSEYEKLYADVKNLISGNDRAAQFMYIAELAAAVKDDGAERLHRFLAMLELVVRGEMLAAAAGKNALLSLDKCVKLLQKTQDARKLLKNNVNLRLLLENLILTI